MIPWLPLTNESSKLHRGQSNHNLTQLRETVPAKYQSNLTMP